MPSATSDGSVWPSGDRRATADTARARATRLLVFTSLYPNASRPHLGRFIEERLRRLVATGGIAATVVAPVPWFPSRNPRFRRYAAFARVPERDERYGISILHPRYPVLPKVGMNVASELMFRACLPAVRRLAAAPESFDMLDAHYFYPDAVAAAQLGSALRKPLVMTARGSDVNVIATHFWPRRRIRWAAARAAALMTVSTALKRRVVALGVPADRITVVPNGVDLERFRPLDRAKARAALEVDGSVWLTVGALVPGKGIGLLIGALAQVPAATLLVAGDGAERGRLVELAHRCGVAARVRFLGAVPHAELPQYYNAADVMLLASASEGMPNVVLESIASGTPVVAAPFESAPEVIAAPEVGEIASERTADAIVAAVRSLQERQTDRAAVRRYATGRFAWEPIITAQTELYARVRDLSGARREVAGASE